MYKYWSTAQLKNHSPTPRAEKFFATHNDGISAVGIGSIAASSTGCGFAYIFSNATDTTRVKSGFGANDWCLIPVVWRPNENAGLSLWSGETKLPLANFFVRHEAVAGTSAPGP